MTENAIPLGKAKDAIHLRTKLCIVVNNPSDEMNEDNGILSSDVNQK